MKFLVITIVILSTLTGELAFGQSFTVYNYGVPDGLPSSEVYEVYQDLKGFLWFATDNGVVRFDGYQMQTFHVKDGLSDPVVFGFFEDNKGRLWFRTFSGKLSYYENGKIFRYRYNDKLTKLNFIGLVNFIVRDHDELWFTVRNIFGKIDSVGTVTPTVIKDQGLFYKTFDNTLLLATSNSIDPIDLVIIDEKKFPVQLTKSAYQNTVQCYVRWRDRFYFSINTDIFSFDGKSVLKIKTGNLPVISISKDRQDNLWIGYLNGGVERFKETDLEESWTPEFLANKSVTKVVNDHEDGYWFTTLENGVFHVPNLLIKHFLLPTQSRIKSVLTHNKNVLVGDNAGSLFTIDQTTKHILRVKTFDDPPILSMFKNRSGTVWLSTTQKIRVLNQELKIEKEYPGLSNDFSEDESSEVWSYGGNSIRSFDSVGVLLEEKSLNVHYRSLYTDDSLIYMAGRTGLQVRNRRMEIVNNLKEFEDYKISNITNLNDSTLLITTIGNGFILLNKKQPIHRVFSTQNGFIADNIYSDLLLDNQLWLGTEKGLIKMPIESLFKSGISFQYLTRKSGLMSDKIDFLLPVDEDIWAFYENTFSVVPVNFSQFENVQPIFYIREVKINDKSIEAPYQMILDHAQNDIHIDFGFISFNNQNIFSRYRITKNGNWKTTNNKQLFFSSLAPGNYSFELEYSIDNVNWMTAVTSVKFTITTPWWNKWYTYAGLSAAYFLFFYIYFRTRLLATKPNQVLKSGSK